MAWVDHLRPGLASVTSLRTYDYRSAPGLIRLDCNEGPPASAAEEAQLIQELGPLALHRYPDVSGAKLRCALAERWKVDPGEILLGNGSIEVLSLLAMAFGGAEVERPPRLLYPDPSFPHYEVIAQTHGLVPVAAPLQPDFGLDERALTVAVDVHRPALAIFASPNNPTGNSFDRDVLVRLARRMDAAFVVDEAYVDFRQGGASALVPLIREIPGFFVTRTFSKVGLAGLRVGALLGARNAIAELDKVRLPWNVNAVSQALATAWISDGGQRLESRVRAIVAARAELESGLRSIPGVIVYPSDANFVLVRTPEPAHLIFLRMLAKGVLVKDVSRPGLLDRCLRITVSTGFENSRCVHALEESLRS